MRVVGIGAGGHAKVVMECFALRGGVEVVGLLDQKGELHGSAVYGVPVIGDDTSLPALASAGVRFAFIGVGSVGSSAGRRALYELAKSHGFTIVCAIHPSAVLASSARHGEGLAAMAGAVVGADAVLGAGVIVNTCAVVEHDCIVGDHAHIATGALLAGGVRIGDGAHVGAGAVIRQGVTVGREAVVGAGAVVVRDVPPGAVVAGVPARELRKAGA